MTVEEHFVFPLGTVLFPGGMLPLRIFEQRYLEMTKTCLRDQRAFGVCLIREGAEVGTPAVPERVGCLATIEEWEMPQLGVFHLVARGGARFRIHETRVAPNGLVSGSVERLPEHGSSAAVDDACRAVLAQIIEKVGASRFPTPIALDDAAWVAWRLAEILPLGVRAKQALLELDSVDERLACVRGALIEHGLVAHA